MAGLWQRMLNSLFTTQKAKQRIRAANRRSLRLEGLERRETMDATISGIVFNDLDASDAQNGAEVGLGGVNVELYNDLGTVGQFDAGVDTLVTTVVSSSTVGSVGRYSFNVTTAGDYLVRQQGTITGFAQRSSQRTQAVNISAGDLTTVTSLQVIDSFDLAAQNISVLTTNPISESASDASVLGTERDLNAERNTGAGDFQIAIDQTNSNLLRISTDGATTGEARIIYDGATDSDPSVATDGAFSPVIDLTSSGAAQGIRLNMRVDANGASIQINVRSASGLSTSGVVPIPVAGTVQEVLFPFLTGTNAIAGTADLTQVTSIELIVTTNADADVDIDQVGTYGQTIETIDIGNIPAMSLGNLVFRDLNNNGLFDGSDAGIGGVTVQLYNDTNGNDVLDASELSAQTTPVSTVTSSTVGTVGQYSFTGLLPGDYIVVVPNSQFAASAALDNLTASIVPASPPGNNANTGVLFSTFGVASAVSLAAGAAPVNDGDTDANTDFSRDFGFTPPTISIVKDDNPDTARVGDPLTYTLTVTNTSPQASGRDSTSTTITDTLPTGLTLVGTPSFTITSPSGTNGVATFDNGTRLISANVGTLVPGQIATLTIIATVGATFANPTSNTGNVTNAEGSTGNSQISTPLAPNVDLGITKIIVGGATSVGVGGNLTYRLTITNNTNLAVTGVTVNDDLPASFTPGTLPSGVATGTAPADLVWSVGNLAANGSATIDIPVTVANNATPGPTFTNTATIVTANQSFTDSNSSNNSASVNIAVTPRYDLRVTKTNNQSTLATGQTFTYTMTAINDGPSSASNVTISDTLPSTLEFISSSVGSATGQVFTANLGTLASGATSSAVNVVVRVRSSATGVSIANTVSVTADDALTQETNTNNNTASDTDPLTRAVTLNITKDDSADPVIAGGATFNYIVTAFNSGTADTTNTVFSDVLPTGIDFVSGTFTINESTVRSGNVSFDSNTRTVSASLGTLLPGTSSTNRALITLVVRANATASAGTVTNTARLVSTDNTVGVTNDETTTINRDFDVTVTKNDNNVETIASGQSYVYTIVVTNTGSSTASNVTLNDPLPANLTFVSATSGFTNNNGTVTGTIASLAAGASSTVTISTTVNNNTPNATVLNNTVTVAASGESNVNNNTASATATVVNTADLNGRVYIDANNNGVFDTGETGIANVTINLAGTPTIGSAVTRTTTTDSTGSYSFTALPIGSYTVTQVQPSNFTSRATNVGTVNGTTSGTGTENQIATINLTGDSVANNFGEIIIFSKRRFLASSAST
jgi:uncharacterized repeat protein (TIGR01451 family)